MIFMSFPAFMSGVEQFKSPDETVGIATFEPVN